jgi:hypothetical protein
MKSYLASDSQVHDETDKGSGYWFTGTWNANPDGTVDPNKVYYHNYMQMPDDALTRYIWCPGSGGGTNRLERGCEMQLVVSDNNPHTVTIATSGNGNDTGVETATFEIDDGTNTIYTIVSGLTTGDIGWARLRFQTTAGTTVRIRCYRNTSDYFNGVCAMLFD